MRDVGNRIRIAAAAVAIVGGLASAGPAANPDALDLLYAGKSADAAKMLARSVREHDQPSARYALGVVQFIAGIENMGQSFYQYGLRNDVMGFAIPFLRLPVPQNPEPESMRYEDFRAIMQHFLDDVGKAERTLAAIPHEEVKLELELNRIQLDIRGGGKDLVPLSAIVGRYLGGRRRLPTGGLPRITMDRADVAWLRGYCHLLSAMAESYLAYDSRPMFERTAHLFFPKAKTQFPFLAARSKPRQAFDWTEILDAVAMIHLVNWEVAEPERLKRAHAHLRQLQQVFRGQFIGFAFWFN